MIEYSNYNRILGDVFSGIVPAISHSWGRPFPFSSFIPRSLYRLTSGQALASTFGLFGLAKTIYNFQQSRFLTASGSVQQYHKKTLKITDFFLPPPQSFD